MDVEAFGLRKEAWLREMLELPNGIPSHDTLGRVFARLDAQQFEHCFTEWVLAVNEVLHGDVVAIDGKTVRRSHDRYIGKDAIHIVSAWACASGVALKPESTEGTCHGDKDRAAKPGDVIVPPRFR